jgi:hypothetical protein
MKFGTACCLCSLFLNDKHPLERTLLFNEEIVFKCGCLFPSNESVYKSRNIKAKMVNHDKHTLKANASLSYGQGVQSIRARALPMNGLRKSVTE